MAPRFTLNRVRLRQYRSIAACDVKLGNLTLMVGLNGAGKSNFLDALRLTAQSLNENLDNSLRERGGIKEVRRISRGHPNSFGVGVDFSVGDYFGTYKFQVGAVSGGDFRVTHEECDISATNFGGDRHYFRVRDGYPVESSEPVVPRVTKDRLFLGAASGLDAFRPVYDGLSSINVYSANPDEMRRLQKPDSGDLLFRDGSNVASVLERLRREDLDSKLRIELYLSQVVDGVSGVDRRGYGSWETVEFRQLVAGDATPWTFQATSMSDGTLRALGVLVALFGSKPNLISPVGIEEPEAALHPAAAGVLLDALRDASSRRQVITTTHSPDLLDSSDITPEELLAVRSEGGISTISHIDPGGTQALRDSLFTAGELLRVDQLIPDQSSRPSQLALFG